MESGEFYNALQYGLAQGEDTDAGRLARELAGKDTAGNADVMRMLREAYDQQEEGRGAAGGARCKHCFVMQPRSVWRLMSRTPPQSRRHR